VYPSSAGEFGYFGSRGQTLVRLPFLWERVQPAPFGSLSAADTNAIRAALDTAQSSNQRVILDMHNYARYFGTPLRRSDAAAFANAWEQIAGTFGGHPALFGYELMNEPHDLPEGPDAWAYLAQAAADGVRRGDSSGWLVVPGYSWQTARFWADNNATLNVSDPRGHVLYAAHQYFDANYTGTYGSSYDADGAYPDIGVDRLRPFQDWLQQRGARGVITEYGVPDNDPRWLTVLDRFLGAIAADPSLLGGTYWAAGPWWGSYPLSVEPRGGADRPQMSVLSRYPSR
jgi:endoglucanase